MVGAFFIKIMKVNKTVFLKDKVWYLSVVNIKGEYCAFWSCHNRVGMNDNDASKAFERQHYNEVVKLTKEKLQNKFVDNNQIAQLQN